jgi:predicted Zn finger-like uncharacterized protein
MSARTFELLVTECPSCHARFRVSMPQLEVAEGRVRCGACLTIFEGTRCLKRESEQEPASLQHAVKEGFSDLDVEATETLDVADDRADLDGLPVDDEADLASIQGHEQAALSHGEDNDEQKLDDPAGLAMVVDDTAALVESHCNASGELNNLEVASARRRSGWIGLGVVVAAIALGVQVLWYQFERWSHEPELRFIYEVICEFAACQLPARRSLSELGTTKLVVQTGPSLEGALIADALILNKASYVQLFPVVELRFDGVNGEVAGDHRFEPEEDLSRDL